MKRNILLVSPDSDNESLWVTGEEASCDQILNNLAPLGLATVAGLTPDEFHVDIWDEIVHGRIHSGSAFKREYDLVGLTGYRAHLPRCREVAAVFRDRGILVAIGGPGVSGSPVEYREHFDVLFIGEVEKTWPQFLKEWVAGGHKPEYRQIEKPDLADSPRPRWDSIAADLSKYAMGGVQTTRGCPFDCEFCDVIYLFGRRARHKPIEHVLEEVRALERLGVSAVFFADDEFIGDAKYTKALLRELIPLNNSFARPLTYSTQLTMNLSKDDELLGLVADANFDLVFVGIETPNKESLREAHKYQNMRSDLAADVHKILSYGIAIRAGIIVGFDHDDWDIFDMQYDFIQRAHLPSVAINMLKAPLGTRLWTRLRGEGRVVSLANIQGKGHPRTYTNILPARLTRVELLRGYRGLLERLHRWEAFSERIRGFVSVVRRRPDVREEPLSLEEARRLTFPLGGGPEGEAAIGEMLTHTARVAPFMLRRVKRLIVQYAKYRGTLARLLPQLDAQLELEMRPGLTFEPDGRAILIPAAFRQTYDRLFPEVHRRVYANLADKERVAEALTEVFVDFLVRWGDTFKELEAYHLTFLREIGDRTCAKFNGEPPETFVPVEPADGTVPDVRHLRLGDDVLKSVEQELSRFMRAATVRV